MAIKMTKEEAKEEIKARISLDKYLEKSKNKKYCCPYCNSGHNEHKNTGAVEIYPDHSWYCFACNKYGDVIDLYENKTGKGYAEAVSDLAHELGIEIETSPNTNNSSRTKQKKSDNNSSDKKTTAESVTKQSQSAEESTKDYRAYYNECASRISDPEAQAYLAKRGISTDTAEKYHVGYDPSADPANAPGGIGTITYPTPRLIVPVSNDYYVGRAVHDGNPAFAKMNPSGSPSAVFNLETIANNKDTPVIVTEGIFDALSVLDMGVSSISLNSTSNTSKLLSYLQEHPTKSTFILALDNDKAGQQATDVLQQGLQQLSIPFIKSNLAGSYNDINERLQKDREGLAQAVQDVLQQTAKKPDNTNDYLDNAFDNEIDNFNIDIKTGFEDLDRQSGGLYSGLYILGATSSSGKTTFLNQMSDQMATAGYDVLFFSLEQSRLEMVAKSLARISYQDNPKTAFTSSAIRKGYRNQTVENAKQKYKEAVGDRVNIIEGNFDCTVATIGDYVRKYITNNSVNPIVIIDYLQVLQPEDSDKRYMSAKEIIDNNITYLKRMSRNLNIPVIAVSSLNRTNYLDAISMEALKESGSIEYTADVIWGLQLTCIECDPLFVNAESRTAKREIIKKEKAQIPRKVDLVCLKNRFGIPDYRCSYAYFSSYDYFEEQKDAYPDWNEIKKLEAEDTPTAGRRIGK